MSDCSFGFSLIFFKQQHPPPYHIAKAFTKKSKQDLLIYDIYRNNYQQQQLPNDHHQDNSLSTQEASESNSTISNSFNAVDLDNHEINANDTINHSRNSSVLSGQMKTWLFGEHKNPTVVSIY